MIFSVPSSAHATTAKTYGPFSKAQKVREPVSWPRDAVRRHVSGGDGGDDDDGDASYDLLLVCQRLLFLVAALVE